MCDNVFLDEFLSIHVSDVGERLGFDPLGEVIYADQ